jgi:hypothetical protein
MKTWGEVHSAKTSETMTTTAMDMLCIPRRLLIPGAYNTTATMHYIDSLALAHISAFHLSVEKRAGRTCQLYINVVHLQCLDESN